MVSEPEVHIYKEIGGCAIRADVFRPEAKKPTPVLVYIHGGALIMGGRRWLRDWQRERYLKAGVAVVSIDYRLAPETKLPEIIEDVKDAVKWVRGEGPKQFNINPKRLGVAGASAGGYLTLMSGIAVEPRPVCLVSFYGYGDIVGDWYSKPDPFYCRQKAVPEGLARMAVGTKPLSESLDDSREPFYLYCRQKGVWPKEVMGRDPVAEREAFKQYCPIQNVSREYPPTLLLHGDKDTDVPYEQSEMMAGALRRAGADSELVTIEGGGHSFDADEGNADARQAMEKVISFLREHI